MRILVSLIHSLCGPLTQFSFRSFGDNETLPHLCIQQHSLTVRRALAAEKHFPPLFSPPLQLEVLFSWQPLVILMFSCLISSC